MNGCPDADGDGIGDNADANDNSDTSATVAIEGMDSGVANELYADGNTLADLVAAVWSASRAIAYARSIVFWRFAA